MNYVATRRSADEWRVAAGSLIAASFTGKDAEAMAREYANERNRHVASGMIEIRQGGMIEIRQASCRTGKTFDVGRTA